MLELSWNSKDGERIIGARTMKHGHFQWRVCRKGLVRTIVLTPWLEKNTIRTEPINVVERTRPFRPGSDSFVLVYNCRV